MKPWHHLVWSLLALSSCVFTIYWSSRVKCFSRILVNWMMMIGDLFSVIERKALCQQRYEYTMWMYDNTAITSWNCIATHRSRMLETIAKFNDPQTVIFSPTICTLFEEIRKKHKLSLVTETLYLNFPDRVVVVADPRFYYYGSALHCSFLVKFQCLQFKCKLFIGCCSIFFFSSLHCAHLIWSTAM